MKKIIVFLFMSFTISLLFSAHNLTVNGQENLDVNLGDQIEIYFLYETIGNTANISLMIDIPLIDTSELDFLQGDLIDGGPLDETGVDGVFQGSISAFWQPPAGIPLLITVTDEAISDQVTLTFSDLETTFSISGNITQESNYGFDLPLYPALVNVLYNVGAADLEDIDFENGITDWMDFFGDRYLISEVNSFLGSYSVNIPDSISPVSCLVMPFSLLDIEGNHTSPEPYFGLIDGVVNNINFHYSFPDGILSGTIRDANNLPLENVIVEVYCEETEEGDVTYSDEMGEFSLPLNNGTYTLNALSFQHQLYTTEFVINDQDLVLDIYLSPVANDNNDSFVKPLLSFSSYPNPFNESLSISLNAKSEDKVDIKVYNLKGQLVRTLVEKGSNIETIHWNGLDSHNKKLANGIYYIQLKTPGKVEYQKVIMLK